MTVDSVARDVTHPLEPLSIDEIRAATGIMRTEGAFGENDRLVGMSLKEPPKEAVLAHRPGDPVMRGAKAVLLVEGHVREVEVSLTEETVTRQLDVADQQAAITLQEFDECEAACKASPEYQAALAKRGITDVSKVIVDPWSFGCYGGGDETGERRLARGLSWIRLEGPDDNAYAHPIDNVVAIVDLSTMEVIRVEDYGVVPVPKESGNYAREFVRETRSDLKPIEISQPEGPSFEVDGNLISWQNWEFRFGFTPKEGLVLHQVQYRDAGELRPVLYRASLAEMVTPYGDPAPSQWRKNAFDAGEYNVGALANSLELGCDCLGEIRYFDAVMADTQGDPLIVKNAICLHEEDFGMLWKHYDFRTEKAEVRRSRRLVISFVATVANYEYAFYWYLYQDGGIEFEIKASGIVSTAAHPPGQPTKYGTTLNGDGLYAPIHQHLFSMRLDMSVDGMENAVYEVDTVQEDSSELNPHGNAFYATERLLETEQGAIRDADPRAARFWKVVNRRRTNKIGTPVAYRLMPKGAIYPYSTPEASITARAGYAQHHLWVTPYSPDEMHAAGEYPNQHPGGGGLPLWTKADRDLVDRDVVLWHTLGFHHVVRLEDWPVMPVQHTGFKMEPVGFFDQNPSLDVPAPSPHCHRPLD